MSLQQTIERDYKQAFKANDRAVVSALRMLKSAIKNREIDVGRELTDEETVEVVSRETKRRREAVTQYQAGGRADLAAHEQTDINVYGRYRPAQLSETELLAIIKETVAAVGATSPSDLGKLMGAVMAKVKGRADGTAVRAAVRRALGA
ncbi:MAG: GatB/YqeY domain-containing protein [Candidatus Kerfeldbacteria bacterium]|nr:GatB/YqeY domain-containing protein [Candidatus Kerfeldbacteria bacterium]